MRANSIYVAPDRHMQKQIAAAGIDDSVIKRQEAIILSMTKKERISVGLLNASRRKRIAAGSGTSVQEVNRLVKQYQDMARMMKKLGGKTGAAAMKALLGGAGIGAAGMGNAGGVPDLSVLSRGLGKGLGGGVTQGLGRGLANGLSGLGGKPAGKIK